MFEPEPLTTFMETDKPTISSLINQTDASAPKIIRNDVTQSRLFQAAELSQLLANRRSQISRDGRIVIGTHDLADRPADFSRN